MNTSSDYGSLSYLLSALLAQTPLYLIYLVGIVVAVIYLKKYPKIALYTIASISISLIAGISLTIVQALLPSYLVRQGKDLKSTGYYFFALGIISTLVHVVAFGLLLLAIFSGRSTNSSHLPPPPPLPKQFE